MYDALSNGKDLYNPNIGKYVFLYNENGALCTYDLNKKQAMNVAKEANGGNWQDGQRFRENPSDSDIKNLTDSIIERGM